MLFPALTEQNHNSQVCDTPDKTFMLINQKGIDPMALDMLAKAVRTSSTPQLLLPSFRRSIPGTVV